MTTDSKREARIRRERQQFGLRPWEFSASEVHNYENPYPTHCIGHQSWERALAWCDEILAVDPDYFHDA